MSAPDLSGITDNYFVATQKGFSDSLNGSITDAATSMTLNSTSGFSTGDSVFLWIEPGAATAELVYGIVGAANTVGSLVRGVIGSAAAHSSGATVTEYVSSADHMLLRKGLLVEHDQDGTHTNITATTVTASGNIETTAGAVKTDTISEHTGAAGVTIDGLQIKDGAISTGGVLSAIHYYTYDGTNVYLDGVSQANGDNTVDWTKPSGLKFAIVEVLGGGGGGAGVPSTGGVQAGGRGGGGGEYARSKLAAADLGSTETVTVGAGGTSANNASGGDGGDSSFGAHVIANGGNGGSVDAGSGGSINFFYGDPGGTGGTGDILVPGRPGGLRIQTNAWGVLSSAAGAPGGDSYYGRGGQGLGTGQITSGNGTAGTGYGGGGGGAVNGSSQGSARKGGVGAAGIVIVYEYK